MAADERQLDGPGLHPIQPSLSILDDGGVGAEGENWSARTGRTLDVGRAKRKGRKGEDRKEGGPTTEWGSSGRRRRPSLHGVPTSKTTSRKLLSDIPFFNEGRTVPE